MPPTDTDINPGQHNNKRICPHLTVFAILRGGRSAVERRPYRNVGVLQSPLHFAHSGMALDDADLVERSDNGYEVYDRLFGIWLSRLP